MNAAAHGHDGAHHRPTHDEGGHGEGRHGESAHAAQMFEPESWDERYSGADDVWTGGPNAQLVAEAASLVPGTALDVGCGEGGDVLWLASQGWRVTGADFSAAGLARAAAHASRAGLADRTDWWQVDARTFDAAGRSYDLVTTHFLHPPDGGMRDVVTRLAGAVAPGGHLLVVGHAPSEVFTQLSQAHRDAMWRAADLLDALPRGFEVLVAQDRPRRAVRDGVTHDIEDATLLARRAGPGPGAAVAP